MSEKAVTVMIPCTKPFMPYVSFSEREYIGSVWEKCPKKRVIGYTRFNGVSKIDFYKEWVK